MTTKEHIEISIQNILSAVKELNDRNETGFKPDQAAEVLQALKAVEHVLDDIVYLHDLHENQTPG